ncbi:MAG: NADH-quinone oxidoreductase subunit N, partial [Syntrophothermus sp.]
ISSNEATLKYFLLGSFLSTFLLFGIALIYGATRSFDIGTISVWVTANATHLPPLFLAGLFLMIIGLAFKIAVVPFHFWAPDVYEGTPTLVTAFMATVVKIAGIVALYRLFSFGFGAISGVWEQTIWMFAVLTIVVGNFTALYQKGLKRMLAYSSISHSGYMMLAVVAFSSKSGGALLLYSAAYSVATITAFGVLTMIRGAKGDDHFSSFEGMGRKNPVEAVALAVAMLSLAGIPPLAGFISKYYLFSTAMEKGYLWLLIVALLGSAISVAYYFRPIIGMFMKEGDGIKIETRASFKWHVLVLSGITLLLGLFPFLLITLL